MLTWLALLAIGALLALILLRLTSALVALTLVPVIAALLGGFGRGIGPAALEGMRAVAPMAALLAFAVVYFGVMNDAGLFAPAVRGVLRRVGRDPVRIVPGTVVVAALAALGGDGASTFMITVPAMLPLYRSVGMSPLTLTCATALAAGTLNMLPWGGPTARAAAALQVAMADLFPPVLPAMLAGLAGVFLIAVRLGRQERVRIARDAPEPRPEPPPNDAAGLRLGPAWYANAALTVATLAALVLEAAPLPVVFLVASALALAINHREARAQRERLTAHASAAMTMVTTVFAAGMFTGILSRSGMLESLSRDLVRALPDAGLRHLPAALGAASMPLSLVFDPDSFYFGLLPVLAAAAQAAGGSAIEVGRAAVLGQMTTGFPVSPLTPSTFLLMALAEVDLADHQRRTIPYAFAVTLLMTVVALATGAIR
jgi:CitMHS family citrate-Mg2+:H+ or citrate-Ca2+:H+ symporter